jgi:hypothetical protein
MGKAKRQAGTHDERLKKRRNSFDRMAFLKRLFRWEMPIIIAAVVCDVNSWGHQFVIDDVDFVVRNYFIQNPANFFQILISPLVPT